MDLEKATPSKADLKDYMLKEIDIIESIIDRMGRNSFLIKGWAITLVVVTLLFKGSNLQILVAFIPLIGFWALDAYYLTVERRFRKLYEWVIEYRLTTDKNLFLMDFDRFKYKKETKKGISYYRTFFSLTLCGFYGLLLLLTAIIGFLVVSLT